MHEKDKIIESITHSFHNIEKHDMRSQKVVFTAQTYHQLQSINSYREYLFDDRVSEIKKNGNQIVGHIFGCDVEIGKENRLFAEPGLVPNTAFISDNEIKPEKNARFPASHYLSIPMSKGYLNILNNKKFKKENFTIDSDTQLPVFTVKIKLDDINFALERVRNRLTIIIKSRANFLYKYEKNEWNAIETLREMITEQEFRKYIKYGFVLVTGNSGRVYQVFRNKSHTKVWEKGRVVEEICVRIKDRKIPLTDNVIAFKQLIEIDENEFKKMGNVYKMKVAA